MTRLRRFALACLLMLAGTGTSLAMVDLPDFSPLVEQTGAAVVNIEATRTSSAAARGGQDMDEQIPEFFRRFFGPGGGMPMPPGRGGGTAMGTGFIISEDGYILTNHHVIRDADEVTVRLDDRRELEAEVVGSDPQTDIALLKVDAGRLPTLAIGSSGSLRPGQWVLAIGSPFGFDHSVTAGIVSATGRANPASNQQYVPFIQTDVAINRGNSGGPLLNTRGEVVGINSQIFSNSGGWMGVSFAIPIDIAMNAVEQIKRTGRVARGQLGVLVQEVSQADARALDLDRPVGALVAQIEPGSAAEDAGIRVQDVIVAFDGQDVVRSSDLPPLVGAAAPGSRVSVTVVRDGRRRDLNATLGEAEQDPSAAASTRGGDAGVGGNALGIAVQEPTEQQRAQLGIDDDGGVVIVRVSPEVAQRTGLRRGDVVTRVGRTDIDSVADFERAVARVEPGVPVMLLIRRGGASQFVTVTPPAVD